MLVVILVNQYLALWNGWVEMFLRVLHTARSRTIVLSIDMVKYVNSQNFKFGLRVCGLGVNIMGVLADKQN